MHDCYSFPEDAVFLVGEGCSGCCRPGEGRGGEEAGDEEAGDEEDDFLDSPEVRADDEEVDDGEDSNEAL